MQNYADAKSDIVREILGRAQDDHVVGITSEAVSAAFRFR